MSPNTIATIVYGLLISKTLLLAGIRLAYRSAGKLDAAAVRSESHSEASEPLWMRVAIAVSTLVWIVSVVVALPPLTYDGWRMPLTPAWRVVGLVMIAGDLCLSAWSLICLKSNFRRSINLAEGHTLVTSGPYALVRHPLYTSFALLSLGCALASVSGPAFIAAICLVGLLWWRTYLEERVLLAAYGESYRDYQARTGRLLPW